MLPMLSSERKLREGNAAGAPHSDGNDPAFEQSLPTSHAVYVLLDTFN